jgi:aldehyde:ferredoxin oxidoreductase
MKRDLPPDAGTVAIGPAGENGSAFAMAFVDGTGTLGRGGFGGAMGAKNLKGIVAFGMNRIEVADRKRYRKLCRELLGRMRDWKYREIWQDLGMLQSFPLVETGLYRKIKKRRIVCTSCPIGCKDEVEIPDGRHKGLIVRSSSAINLFTPVIYGIEDYRESIRLVHLLDELGLDMFEFFGVMQCAAKLAEGGMLESEPPIILNDPDSMAQWAEIIARREGEGDILADGFKGLIERFGDAAKETAPALVKGMHPYTGPRSALPWDRFGTMELGQVLDPRGPHVGSGGSPTYFAERPLGVFPKHLRRMGVPEKAIDRIVSGTKADGTPDLDVGALLRYSHAWFATLGSVGVCARAQINRFYSQALCAELYEAVTGIETSADDLRKRVDRVWTLYRQINIDHGLGGESEEAPPEWFKEPGFKDYISGTYIDEEDVRKMIQRYYAEWGWDPETGRPNSP